jgi:hypothetical protein
VVDSTGQPIRGIKVISVTRRTGLLRRDEGGRGAFTDGRGIYRLHGLFPGTYSVAVVPDESEMDVAAFSPVYWPGFTDPGRAEYFPLAAGEVKTGVDLTLHNATQIELSGIVRDIPPNWETGRVAVVALSLSSIVLPMAITLAADSGEFIFHALPPAQYRLVAWGPIVGWGAGGPFTTVPGRRLNLGPTQ